MADELTEAFESVRPHLRRVAYRLLGSPEEAEDAVQEAWLRLHRSDTRDVTNLAGWLTTVVARISLDMLRSRSSRREHLTEQPGETGYAAPVAAGAEPPDPVEQAVLADTVGVALFVVLDRLKPAERIAFVLHDLFGVSFEEIAPVVGTTATAARQLASRARRRVQGAAPSPDADLTRQREVVDAFLAASRDGDFDALVAVLAPDAVVRSDGVVVRGAEAVAAGARTAARLAAFARPALVNGVAGVVVVEEGRPVRVLAFTVVHDRIAAIDIVADPERLAGLDLTVLDDN
jgi:RNA polymerase sigma factor (sigma-70 family)